MRKALFAVLVLFLAPVAFGQACTGFSGGTEYDSYYGSAAGDVIGWRFTVSESVEVTDLGTWNMDQTGGLESPHDVGIWDASQALLGSVVVDNTGTPIGDWMYASVTPFIIDPGQIYTIGALYVSGDDDWYVSSASSGSWAPEVTFVESVYPLEGELGFVFPELSSASIGRFGPNFIFQEAALEQTTWGEIKTSF